MTASAKPRCVAVGHLTHDRYGDKLAAGGSSLYAARVMQALGADVAIVTSYGDDYEFLFELQGIARFVTPSNTTTVFENTYPEGAPRSMLVEHPASIVRPDSLDPKWRHPTVLFLAPVIGEVKLDDWLQGSKDATTIIGLGLQGFLKQPEASRHGGAGSPLRPKPFDPPGRLLNQVAAVFLSEEDLRGFAAPTLLDRLRRHVPIVSVSDGENGATIYRKTETFKVGIRPVPAVDPTGAGDTFAAGFLMGLALGKPPKDAARLGAAAASIIVQGVGPATLRMVEKAPNYTSDIPIY